MMPDYLDARTHALTGALNPSGWDELVTPLDPVITYIDGELEGPETGASLSSEKDLKRTCHLPLRGSRRRSFTTRARRQRRLELAEFDALPIVRRARAAGLHGAALRGYVAAVEALDGPLALSE